jgi:hypothetical protein
MLTKAGTRHLEQRVRRWRELSGAVDAVLGEGS